MSANGATIVIGSLVLTWGKDCRIPMNNMSHKRILLNCIIIVMGKKVKTLNRVDFFLL
jgi:hypothetical protein